MSPWLWALVILPAVWAAHWGAERMAEPLKKLRKQWGLTQVAGAAFVGFAAASPEIGISTAAALREVGDIGIGADLGSNVLAIPLVVTVAYLATRRRRLGGEGAAEEGESAEEHQRHLDKGVVHVVHEIETVQALPYLVIVGLFALLVLPPGWRGLQPLDGWLLLGAYALYAFQALARGRKEGEDVEWSKKEVWLAAGGLAALAIGAYFTVRATENLVSAFGVSRIVGGLFITAPMAALPELFAVWSVSKSGQVTAATGSVMGDHAVTMTVAHLPLALVGLPVQNLALLATTLAFVALMPILFALMAHFGAKGHGFKLWQALVLDAVYVAYVLIVVFAILRSF